MITIIGSLVARCCRFWPLFVVANVCVAANQPLNVLMIVVDDLRPMLGCYGDTQIVTPNIDRLARQGTLFQRAYCQAPQCGPSREAVLTGLRPETTGIYTLNTRFQRAAYPHVVTLPELFKKHGYHTQSFGKVYHDDRDDAQSWSVPSTPGRRGEMWEYIDEDAIKSVPFAQRGDLPSVIRRYSPDVERKRNCDVFQAADVPDDALFEGRMTAGVVATLDKVKGKPFFLGVGFRRPHLPWVAPKKYFDLYPSPSLPAPDEARPAANAPIVATYHDSRYLRSAWDDPRKSGIAINRLPDDATMAQRFFTSTEIRSYRGVDFGAYPSAEDVAAFRRAYMACVSYVDAQVGRLLDALERTGLAKTTAVVLWSDHGWHLGEHGTFGKLTNYEWSTRVPLIIASPRHKPAHSAALVELSDVYPSLCDLAGLPVPEYVEGTSVVPLLENPKAVWKSAAFTHYLREEGAILGRSVRTADYRYVEWVDKKSGKLQAEELYDHRTDPGERVSVHGSPERQSDRVQLREILQAGWRAARPVASRR